MDKISNSELADVVSAIIIDSANNRPDLYEKEGLTVREARAFALGISLSCSIVKGLYLGFGLDRVVEAAINTLSKSLKAIESEGGCLDTPEKAEQ